MDIVLSKTEPKTIKRTFAFSQSTVDKIELLFNKAKELDHRASRTALLESMIAQFSPQNLKGKP